ncbi:hypothetical protein BS47DRAFT_1486754 [Hydnum rufescens UP504]|uniref:Phytase A n=1 Tax=Hydnum rufescens UP504 TaxID=1448309 RepID=A0A9P6AU38_9AGAM|nr:hypothetical protein BS47DRAFT_1486754 [Hydnum rufescens UP504]
MINWTKCFPVFDVSGGCHLFYILAIFSVTTRAAPQKVFVSGGPHVDNSTLDIVPPYIGHHLGQDSPYFPADNYIRGPDECTLRQVNMIYRHGARFPTERVGRELQQTLAKLKAADKFASPDFEFLRNYTYSFGEYTLLPYGAKEHTLAGAVAFERYGHLVFNNTTRIPPFIRATDASRVMDSAGNWSAGFIDASPSTIEFTPPLIIPRTPEFNNTLDNHNCPAITKTIAVKAQASYSSTFIPPITSRLNSLAPGAALTDVDTVHLFRFCAFDSVVIEATSPFCRLFSKDEFRAYEYYQDLGKYYFTGYGNPLGPVQGIGYVNELLARLTSTPVNTLIDSNINRTLDGSHATFPLDRTLYVDFSHDNQITAIVSAMGLHKPGEDLPTSHPVKDSPWVYSRIAPFAGRLVVEKYSCPGSVLSTGDGRDTLKDGEWVRILNSDVVLPQPGCSRWWAAAGLCELGAFVESQAFSRNTEAVDAWAKCFAM